MEEKEGLSSSDDDHDDDDEQALRAKCARLECELAALRAASAAPAALLGLDAKGRLTPGADADLVLLAPDDLSVRACFVGGRLAWAHEELHGALWFHT